MQGQLAQLGERQTEDLKVPSSILGQPTVLVVRTMVTVRCRCPVPGLARRSVFVVTHLELRL